MGPLVAISRYQDGQWIGILGKASFAAHPRTDQVSFFAPDFALKTSAPWLVAEESFAWDQGQLQDFLKSRESNLKISLQLKSEPDFSSFIATHRNILQQISNGEFKKVVPAVFSQWQLNGNLPGGILALQDAESRLWPYGFAYENEGMLGLTPEVLFIKEGLEVKTQAVAGTQKLNGPSLFLDKKEILEHELVVEDLTTQLADLGTLTIEKTEERPAGTLKHLVTDIVLKLREEVDFIDLVKRLHPSAALGGFPRAATKNWLESRGDLRLRRRFGAPFGWRTPNGDGVCLVAIRNLQWDGDKALIGSGCGVVEGSVAEREWQELALKRNAIVNALKVNV